MLYGNTPPFVEKRSTLTALSIENRSVTVLNFARHDGNPRIRCSELVTLFTGVAHGHHLDQREAREGGHTIRSAITAQSTLLNAQGRAQALAQ